jgi:hypothetical protein
VPRVGQNKPPKWTTSECQNHATQVSLYKADWIKRVEAKRSDEGGSTQLEPIDKKQVLRYLQIEEKSQEYSYEFEAEYVLVGSSEPAADSETNLHINAFVTRQLQRFRANAIASAAEKNEMKKSSYSATSCDFLSISHSVSLVTLDVLSLEFQLTSYGAGAAHPNTCSKTLNFRLHPPLELELHDIFKRDDDYLKLLSGYCVNDLHRQQLLRWHDPAARAEQVKNHQDEWILRGAGPEYRNFERCSLRKNGVVIHFDPYQVGSYAEGKYEVFIPSYELKDVLQEEIAALLN